MNTIDELYMRRCLQLARCANSFVPPNPMVGAVLVVGDKIIGEGYHKKYGEAHAEVNAIQSVKDKSLLTDATLYVSLEPCSHHGKTPPCAAKIIECGIRRVVVGTLDPNPKVAGKGIRLLKDAGVDITVGVLEQECKELNKRFFVFQLHKRPYIILKWAQTADGYIDIIRADANEKPLKISNTLTSQMTHRMRSENQAIMVSTNTVLLDNPSLSVRYWTGKNPIRVILDRQGRLPESYTAFNGLTPTLVFTELAKTNKQNVQYITIDFSDNVLDVILDTLYQYNIHSVLVEGGAQLLNSFIEADKWDEIAVEQAPVFIGDGVKAPRLSLLPCSVLVLEGHQCFSYKKNIDEI